MFGSYRIQMDCLNKFHFNYVGLHLRISKYFINTSNIHTCLRNEIIKNLCLATPLGNNRTEDRNRILVSVSTWLCYLCKHLPHFLTSWCSYLLSTFHDLLFAKDKIYIQKWSPVASKYEDSLCSLHNGIYILVEDAL